MNGTKNGKQSGNERQTNSKTDEGLLYFISLRCRLVSSYFAASFAVGFRFVWIFFRSFAVRCHFVWCLLPVHLPFVVASFSRRLPFVAALFAEAKRGGTRNDRGYGKLSKLDRYRVYGICCVCNTFSWIYLAAKRTSLFGSEAPLGYRENAVRRQKLTFTSTT